MNQPQTDDKKGFIKSSKNSTKKNCNILPRQVYFKIYEKAFVQFLGKPLQKGSFNN